ncbi:calcium ion binding protein [Aureococcus anophagefferens]|nr:calcium ion binding protein [Aureococcus anophagefferens]
MLRLLLACCAVAAGLDFVAHELEAFGTNYHYAAVVVDVDGDGGNDALAASYVRGEIYWYDPAAGSVRLDIVGDEARGLVFSVFAADVDGDGDVDVVAGSVGAGDLGWYANDGSEQFAYAHIADAAGPYTVAAADVDGDGAVEFVAVAFNDDAVAWYEAEGTTYVVAAAAYGAYSVHAADVDGDGDLDLVAASYSDDTVRYFANDGAGNFDAEVVVDGDADGAIHVGAADVDADGAPDVLAVAASDFAFLWYENGLPYAGFAKHTATAGAGTARSLAAADLDGDGDVDLLPAEFSVYHNYWLEHDLDSYGDVAFTARALGDALESGQSPAVAAPGDLDGDGDVDALVGGVSSGAAASWPGTRTAPSRPADAAADGVLRGRRLRRARRVDGLPGPAPSARSTSTATATRTRWPRSRTTPSRGTRTTARSPSRRATSATTPSAAAVAAVDVDGDGDLDVLTVNGNDDAVLWYENDGSQSFTKRVITTLADNAVAAAGVDVDGDGDVDVVAASMLDDTVAWHANDGSQSFTERIVATTLAYAIDVDASDVDGDGDLDLIVAAYEANAIVWFENDGSESFSHHVITAAATGATDVVHVDLDGDGDVDALSASTDDDTIAWYENDGSQSFTERIITTLADGAMSVFPVDIDGDGDVDVLAASYYDDTVAWYENDGADGGAERRHDARGRRPDDTVAWYENDCASHAPTAAPAAAPTPRPTITCASVAFAEHIVATTAGGGNSVFAIDVDGDGDVDALAAFAADTVVWYENDGSQSFTEHIISWLADDAASVFAIDVDGDGDVDALSASKLDDTVAWYENDGSESFSERIPRRSPAPPSDGAMSVFAIDVDGDGDVDVLSASYYDDTVAWYENGGSQSFTEHVLTNSANGAWFVSAADADGDGDVDVLSAAYLGNTVAWHENGGGAFAQIDGHCDGYASFERICPSSDATCGGWSDFIVGQGGAGDSLVACQTRCAEASCGGIYFDDAHGCGNYDACADSGDGQNWGASFYIRVSNAFTERVIATHAVYAVSVFAIDVDGDGDVDALSSTSSVATWYENDGAQSFTERLISSVGAGSLVAIDVDADGDVDALSVYGDGASVAWYENDCGTFAPTSTLAPTTAPTTTRAPSPSPTPRPMVSCASVSFAGRVVTDSADGAYSVFAIDVDGDDDVDVLSASYSDDTVSWYENDGSQSFTERIITTLADNVLSVFAIDVDGDGDVDALSASYMDDTVAWYENDASEPFTERVITYTADAADSVYAIDVDGDGDADALSASKTDDTVAWYENDGTQSFTERIITTLADGAMSVFPVDIDGDGDVDVLAASYYDDTVAWYENGDAQSFTERIISTTADFATSVFAIDVDGDGDVDVLSASGSDNTVAWYENDGAQSFTKRIISASAGGAYAVFAIDLDGDGDVDPLSASPSDDTVAWYENDGSQSFTERVFGTPDRPRSVYAIDVDGDGDVDALSASADDDTVAWYEDDCETAAPTAVPSAETAAPTAVPSASTTPTTSLAPTSAAPTPRPTTFCTSVSFLQHTISNSATGAFGVYAFDVDGDGVDDVLSASYSDDTVAWFENDGSQSFTERILTTLAEGARNVFAIDVDGDGDADALSASNGDDTVAWYENDGSQSFAERVITTLADAAQSVFAIDVDGDGDVDAPRRVSVVAIDVDGDGDVDVLSASQLDNTIAWYENDGSQSFTARVVTNAADAAYSVFAIDVDGDGDADALSASADDDTVAWYENDGSQSFAELVIADAADQANTVFAFDVDGDGDIDALSSSYGDDTVSWYENDGSQSFTTRIITTAAPTPTPCDAVAAGSYAGPPPRLAAAAFTSTGAALTVAFDAPTDLGGFAAGEAFGCAALLDMADGDVAQCDWTDASTLNVLVSSALAVVPGVTVALKPGVLKAPCDDAVFSRCDCVPFASNSSAVLAPPATPLVPSVVLQGPTSAAVCEGGFEVSGDQSTGSGGRAFVVRDWNATAAHAVAVRHDTPPVVTVVGGLRQATARPQALSVTASALATSCDGRAAGPRRRLRLGPRGRPRVDVARPRYFKLPPFALSVGTHALTLVVRDAQHAASNTSTALSVVVARSAVVAVVDGGDRVVPASSPLRLSASESYDEDVPGATGANAGLAFTWTCDELVLEDATGEALDVSLDAGLYTFRVNATAADGTHGAATALIDVVAADPPRVAASAVPPRVASTLRLSLSGDVDPSSLGRAVDAALGLNSTWAVVAGALADGAALEAVAATRPALRGPARRGRTRSCSQGALVAGGAYALELGDLRRLGRRRRRARRLRRRRAADERRRRRGAGVRVALETLFALETRSWVTADAPLTYAFKAGGATLRAPTLEPQLEGVVLKEGAVVVAVVAYDSLGGSSGAETVVLCAPPAPETLAALAADRLDEAAALGNSEAVAQTQSASAVAAAAAADGGVLLGEAAAATALNATAKLAARSRAVGFAETTAESCVVAMSALLDNDDARRRRRLNIEAPAEPSATRVAVAAVLDDVAVAATAGAVAGEDPVVVSSDRIDVTSAALPLNATPGVPNAVSSPRGGRAVALPDAIGGPGDAVVVVLADLYDDDVAREDDDDGGDVAREDDDDGAPSPAPSSKPSPRLLSSAPTSLAPSSASPTLAPSSAPTRSPTVAPSLAPRPGATTHFGVFGGGNESLRVRLDLARASTLAEGRETANLTCPCGFVGDVNHTCADGAVVSQHCDGAAGAFELRCPGEKHRCFRRRKDGDWGKACETSTSDTGVVSCACAARVNRPGDYRVETDAVASSAAYVGSFVSVPDLGRSAAILLALLGLAAAVGLVAAGGRVLDRRDAAVPPPSLRSRMLRKQRDDFGASTDQLAYFGSRESLDVIVEASFFAKATTLLKKNHALLNIYYVHSDGLSRPLRALKLGVEILLFLWGVALSTAMTYPDPGCDGESTRRGCLQYVNLNPGGVFKTRRMCKWDRCSGSCVYRAPNANATATTEHYFTLALTMALLLPLIAVLDVIFDTYVAAPSPFAHAREKAGEKPEAEKSHRTLDALDEPSFSFVPEGLARPDVDAAVARHCETPKATARKRAKKWTTYFRRRLAAFRRNVGESLGETRSLRHKSAALEETVRKLAPAVAEAVVARDEELQRAIDGAFEESARVSLKRLRSRLRNEWDFVEDRAVFRATVRAILQRHILRALVWDEELSAIKGDTPEKTRALKGAKLFELERLSKLGPAERNIYRHSITSFDEDAAVDVPTKARYVGAIAAEVVLLLYIGFYLVAYGSDMGRGRTIVWLYTVSVSLALYYAVISPLEVLFFGYALPSLLAEHFEKFEDPTSLSRYPFETKLPSVATYFLALWHEELHETRIGRHCLGTLHEEAPDTSPEALKRILADATWRPTLQVRATIFLVSGFVTLPVSWQEVLFEEVFTFTPFCSQILTAVVGVDLTGGGSSGRRAVDVSTIVNLVGVIVLLFISITLWQGGSELARRLSVRYRRVPPPDHREKWHERRGDSTRRAATRKRNSALEDTMRSTGRRLSTIMKHRGVEPADAAEKAKHQRAADDFAAIEMGRVAEKAAAKPKRASALVDWSHTGGSGGDAGAAPPPPTFNPLSPRSGDPTRVGWDAFAAEPGTPMTANPMSPRSPGTPRTPGGSKRRNPECPY